MTSFLLSEEHPDTRILDEYEFANIPDICCSARRVPVHR